ncbi:MAG: Rrf2 family transcriptional regulator [Lachnospiraceae bacterium]|nr:Rrf2 family transcriptional regulator [Lachnospiraceae bacterium]
MMISTRGRYAVRVMSELGTNPDDLTPLKSIADKQDISQKYLENIMSMLVKAKLVAGASGKGGGYKLVKEPKDYTLYEILEVTEGDLYPVTCLTGDDGPCKKAGLCHAFPIWKGLSDVINEYLEGKTLQDVIDSSK